MAASDRPLEKGFITPLGFWVSSPMSRRRALAGRTENRAIKCRLMPPCGVAARVCVLTIRRLLGCSLCFAPCLTSRRWLHLTVWRADCLSPTQCGRVSACSGRHDDAQGSPEGTSGHGHVLLLRHVTENEETFSEKTPRIRRVSLQDRNPISGYPFLFILPSSLASIPCTRPTA